MSSALPPLVLKVAARRRGKRGFTKRWNRFRERLSPAAAGKVGPNNRVLYRFHITSSKRPGKPPPLGVPPTSRTHASSLSTVSFFFKPPKPRSHGPTATNLIDPYEMTRRPPPPTASSTSTCGGGTSRSLPLSPHTRVWVLSTEPRAHITDMITSGAWVILTRLLL